jgi:hypothetical protein
MRPIGLSAAARALTGASGAAFAVTGVLLFAAPGWASTRFAWTVSAFVTMTIGGWCLGTAWVAWVAVRSWPWAASRGALAYLWSFAVLESLVLVWFRDRVTFHVLTWPYLVALGLGVAAAAIGLVELVRRRPVGEDPSGAPVPGWLRGLIVAFVVFVAGLAAVAALRPGQGATLRVFPQRLSPFTVRGFGAFYLSLGLGAAAVMTARTITPTIVLIRCGLGLIVPITAAAFVYLGEFDVADHPLQALYIGAYLVVLVLSIPILRWAARRRAESPDGSPTATGGQT